MRSICITLTSPFVLNAFLLGHITRLSKTFRVVVCINQFESNLPLVLPQGVKIHHVEIRRNIAPIYDVMALCRLIGFYRRSRFTAVFSITPKGGLLAMLAARLTGVPVRVHSFTGQVWSNKTGIIRLLLKLIDRLLARCASALLADSSSQRLFLINEKIVAQNRISVIGSGSISGVNLERFRSNPVARDAIRKDLGILDDELCLLYVGRMKRDKGILDLLASYKLLRIRHPRLHLLMVGPDEENLLNGHLENGVHCIGYTQKVENYMAAADIMCLPSYREGFGTVLIEAAATGLPAIASQIYGITDAVVDGETGLLHEAGNVAGIVTCVERLLADPSLRSKLAANAQIRAVNLFSSERIESLLSDWLLAQINQWGISGIEA